MSEREEKDRMAGLIMKAYPYTSFQLSHAKMIASYLINNGIGSKDRFTTEIMTHNEWATSGRKHAVKIVPIDYNMEER